jgi:hypothetical protein
MQPTFPLWQVGPQKPSGASATTPSTVSATTLSTAGTTAAKVTLMTAERTRTANEATEIFMIEIGFWLGGVVLRARMWMERK